MGDWGDIGSHARWEWGRVVLMLIAIAIGIAMMLACLIRPGKSGECCGIFERMLCDVMRKWDNAVTFVRELQ